MLVMVENSIIGGMCHTIYRYAKAKNKNLQNYDKIKEPSDLKYWDVNNPYGCAVPQRLPVDGFKLVENTSQFNKDFTENYNEYSTSKRIAWAS